MALDLCMRHQQDSPGIQFHEDECNFCKVTATVARLREELVKFKFKNETSPKIEDGSDSDEVYLQVPQPLFNLDAELNTMAMLGYVMAQNLEILTDNEVVRISTWFVGRFGNHEED